MTIKGRIEVYYGDGVAIQPDFSLTEKNDGTIEGQVNYECDESKFANLPQIGSAHPRDNRAECYNRVITYGRLGKIKLTASYFGLVSATTDKTISYTPNTNTDPITSHPDFSTFAGTKDDPVNGAEFDEDTGEFLGFFDPDNTDLFGVENYLIPASLVSTTFWQRSTPTLSKRMTRRANIPGFKKPDDVKEFMLLDTPYRQVGNFYQVTEQYMGSGPNGFSATIYP